MPWHVAAEDWSNYAGVTSVRLRTRVTCTSSHCMQKVALQAGRLEDSGDVAWRDLERLLQIAGASTSTQLTRTTDFFVQYGLSRLESVDPWVRYTGKRLWEWYLWIVLKLLPDTI